ncbi:EthD family reductase [Nonomuraea sp. LPB2021202275-12-8]|uniref:EthD family reductase n=1 Tax=Nonomuraea sp. LPB2021202275-12-8 TaxID=3120159 RepID=UPI00300CFAA8
MAFQLIALYNHPESVSAFDKHYDETHTPIAARMPGLRAYTVTRPAASGQRPAYHLAAVLTFDDEEAFNAAMGSEAGQAALADLANFAGAGVTILTGPTETVA